MKKALIYLLFALLPLAAAGSSPDGLVLSADSLTLDCFGGTGRVDIAQGGWWVKSISVDSLCIETTRDERRTMRQGRECRKTLDWLTIATEPHAITFLADDNLGHPRAFRIVLQKKRHTACITGIQEEVRVGGAWPDVIQPSQRDVSFPKAGGSVTVTTQGDSWLIASVTVDGNLNILWYNQKEGRWIMSVTEEGYLNTVWKSREEEGTFSGTYDWLTIDVRKANTGVGREITLTATPNDTDGKRTFRIDLQEGDCFVDISGTQE